MNKRTIQVVPGFRLRQQQSIDAASRIYSQSATLKNTHVNGEVKWFEAAISTYWETADSLAIELSDGTTRRMNKKNWGSTFETTRMKVLESRPGRMYLIGTWGQYSEESWFCDISPSKKTGDQLGQEPPWMVMVSNSFTMARVNGELIDVRNGVSTYHLNVALDDDESKNGVWAYRFDHHSLDRTITNFTKQKFIKSNDPLQRPYVGKVHEVDINYFLQGDEINLKNMIERLEKLYFSKKPVRE